MATNREVKAALLKKLAVTPQRLSQRAQQVKRLYGPMSTEDAVYVLAHQEGIDLTKHLDRDTVDRVRGLLPPLSVAMTAAAATRRPRQSRPASASSAIRVAPSLELVDVGLPKSDADAASRMATIYPKLYLFENSIRRVIVRVMEAKHGRAWWKMAAPSAVQNKVRDRKAKEAKTPWHGSRGTHEIYYADFGNLRDIITKNWKEFEPIFLKQTWITQRLDELEPPRNIVAHNNPLSRNEASRIDLYFNDWVALYNDRKGAIPRGT